MTAQFPAVLTAVQPVNRGVIDLKALEALAGHSGTAMTFLLPDQRPGAATGQHHQLLRRLVQEARTEFGASELIRSVEALGEQPDFWAGGPGFAIFRAQDWFECYRSPGIERAEVVNSRQFALLPLLKQALTPQECFILNINRKQMELFRYGSGECSKVEWPAGVPAGLGDAEAHFKATPENRAATGVSPGSMWSVQFGASNRPDREGAGTHVAHFFRLVDSGIAPALKGQPLLLAGVEEDLAAYRRASRYPAIWEEEIDGSVSHMALSEIAKRSRAAAVAEMFRAGASSYTANRQRLIDEPKMLLDAASGGKIHRLWIREDALGFESKTREWVNSCLAETLFFGGDVFLVRTHDMPTSAMAGIARY